MSGWGGGLALAISECPPEKVLEGGSVTCTKTRDELKSGLKLQRILPISKFLEPKRAVARQYEKTQLGRGSLPPPSDLP